MDDAVAADLDLPDHPAPAAQGQQRRGEERLPLGLGDAQDLERLADRLQRPDLLVLQPGQLRGQPAQPAVGRPARLAVQRAEGAEEPLVAAGQRPVGQALVEERGAEADQQVVDQRVGVLAGRLEQQVAVPDRRRRRRR